MFENALAIYLYGRNARRHVVNGRLLSTREVELRERLVGDLIQPRLTNDDRCPVCGDVLENCPDYRRRQGVA